MIFPTVQFAIFLPVVLALSWALMRHQRAWKPFMLVASYAFYGAAGWKFCVLLAAITVGNQIAAKWIHRTEDPATRKRIMVAAVVLDVAILGVFKYYGFFAEQINGVLDTVGLGLSAPLVAIAIPLGVSFITFQAISYTVDVWRRTIEPASTIDVAILGVFKYYGFFAEQINGVLDTVGLGLSAPLVAIAIPLGVSFITFQAISYTVDVWRRTIEPASTIDVALYLAFFPHVVAGPIVRAREFLPQLRSPRSPKDIAVGAGVGLIALGLIKKVMIADFLAREVVDPVFAVPDAYAAPDVALASYAYAAQIFCDFSGYTDIAIGVALLFGFVFPQNFDRPYGQTSITAFWRHWHMTLSRFLRDFIYIPLGGNRRGEWITRRNLFLTMLIGGLWHGAAWTFVLWGALHGAALVVERTFRGKVRLPVVLRWLLAFHVVVLLFVLFRAPDLGIAGDLLGRLTDFGAATLWTVPAVLAVVVVVGLQLVPRGMIEAVRLRIEGLNAPALGLGLAAVVIMVAATVPSQGVPPFIYFQF